MKTSQNFLRLEQKDGKVFWNKTLIKALGDNRNDINDQEYDITPDIQK